MSEKILSFLCGVCFYLVIRDGLRMASDARKREAARKEKEGDDKAGQTAGTGRSGGGKDNPRHGQRDVEDGFDQDCNGTEHDKHSPGAVTGKSASSAGKNCLFCCCCCHETAANERKAAVQPTQDVSGDQTGNRPNHITLDVNHPPMESDTPAEVNLKT